jgi:ribose/xylose/arabinose/galactoside ABC-type transport system permease subunit
VTITRDPSNLDDAALDRARPAAPRRSASIGQVLLGKRAQSLLTVGVFVALFCGYGFWLGERFMNLDARLLNVHQNVPILLLGLAAVITLVAGLFDLSIASMATFAAYLAVGLRTQQGLPFEVVLLLCLGVGVLGGIVNGVLVEYLRVNTFIATLGTGGVLLGISSVYSDGGPLAPLEGQPAFPDWFSQLGAYTSTVPSWVSVFGAVVVGALLVRMLEGLRPGVLAPRGWLVARAVGVVVLLAVVHLVTPLHLGSWLSYVSWLVGVLMVAAFIVWVLLERTSFGRSLKASGSNPTAARLAGVHTSRFVMGAFVLGGVYSALAGVMLAATTGTVSPNMAGPFLLPAFAAAFLSTVVFSTGHFTVWGAVVGGVFVVWVSQGLIVGGLPSTWTDLVNGAVLVAAVAVSTFVRRSRRA